MSRPLMAVATMCALGGMASVATGQPASAGESGADVEARQDGDRLEPRLVVQLGHDEISSVAFSPDGKSVLTGSLDQTAILWDVETGKERRRLAGHAKEVFEKAVYAVAFAPDGTSILTGRGDGTVIAWDAETGEERRRLAGHTNRVFAVAFAPDGTRILTGSGDNTAVLRDAGTGAALATLISFDDGTWAVTDPKGRFDAPDGGDVAHLHWVVGREVIELSQLKERFYEPGLLSKVMGCNDEPLSNVEAFDHVDLYPDIALGDPDTDDGRLGITLTKRGDGYGRVQVFINGKEIQADARGGAVDQDAETVVLPALDLTDHPYLKPGEENVVEVRAFNKEGYLSSRGVRRTFKDRRTARTEAPHLWAVVIGTADYQGTSLDLRYAAKDAEDIATALRIGARELFKDRLHLTLLTTSESEGAITPTRRSIEEAFEAARAAKPTDILLVYLAGHGVTHDGEFYYLTRDAKSAQLTDDSVRRQWAMSSRELTGLIQGVPALKQVLILDTCASGAVAEKLSALRNVPGNQVRALDRMKDRMGMHVLAGCASDAVSYEATRYAQGLLTYSLLQGMLGDSLRDGEFVDVSRWFQFARENVPRLARDIGGIQTPVVATPRTADTFDVGRLTDADKREIPLEHVRPMFVRSNFRLGQGFRDPLRMKRRVEEALREAASAVRGAPLVYIDADEAPDAYAVAGAYRIDGESVRATVFVSQGDEDLPEFTVSGTKSDPDALARSIAQQAAALAAERIPRPATTRKSATEGN